MILLDTNVLIYASIDRSPFLEWARRTIAAAYGWRRFMARVKAPSCPANGLPCGCFQDGDAFDVEIVDYH